MAKRRLGAIAIFAAIVALSLGMVAPAGAASNLAAAVTGSGTITPALLTPPACGSTAHTFTGVQINFAGQVNSVNTVGTAVVNSAGNSGNQVGGIGGIFSAVNLSCENDAQGEGSGLANGTYTTVLPGGGGNVSCPYKYLRVVGHVHVELTCTFTGVVAGSVTGACEFAFQPTSNPVSSYLLEGGCAFQ